MAKRKSKGDVEWHIPNRKRPIAYSTKSTSDLIGLLSEIFYSIRDVQRGIFYDKKAHDILQIYIDKGYAEIVASDFFMCNTNSYTLNWYTKHYDILIANFPFMNSIDEAKKYIEYRTLLTGKRKWLIKKPFRNMMESVYNQLYSQNLMED